MAQELDLRLCCHPDDPPFSLLGLPRIMSSTDDYGTVLDVVDLQANGATLCTGSLGVSPEFDGPDFVRRHGDRIHFVHCGIPNASPDQTVGNRIFLRPRIWRATPTWSAPFAS